jgi:shikimate kinase
VGAEPGRVVLVGFMGAGKSTVGPLLADLLGWRFLDLDDQIEERAGITVARFFAERGEPAFREAERQAAEDLVDRRETVLATGGGAFAQPATREALRRNAVTVWLRVDLTTALRRLPRDGARPLAGNRAIMEELLAEREPAYALADLEVEAEDDPVTVARLVAAGLRERGFLGGHSDT